MGLINNLLSIHMDSAIVNNPSDFTLKQLSEYFQYPINEAAEKLGICATVLKKICRKNGVSRWPHRKIKSIDTMIDSVKEVMDTHPESVSSLGIDLDELYKKRQYLLDNPNVSYKSVVSKYCINAFNAKVQKVLTQNSPNNTLPVTSNVQSFKNVNIQQPSINVQPSLSFRPTKEIVKKAPRSPVKHTTKLPHISSFVNDVPKMPRLSDSVNNLESEAIVTLTAMNECRPLYENSKEFKEMVQDICSSMAYSRISSPPKREIIPFYSSLRASTEQLVN